VIGLLYSTFSKNFLGLSGNQIINFEEKKGGIIEGEIWKSIEVKRKKVQRNSLQL
jgi:hypothetical protein